jgi:CubicO group peptidase (beta-lactamase class C family)
MTLLSGAAASRADAQDEVTRPGPGVDALVASYLEAIGGREANLAVRTRRLEGTLTLAALGTPWRLVTTQRAPGSSHSRLEVPGYGVVEEGCDGTEAWKKETGVGLVSFSGPELRARIRDARFHGVTELLMGPGVSFAGEEEIAGVPVHVLRVADPGRGPWAGASYEVHLDPETSLVRRLVVAPAGSSEAGRTTVESTDYRDVDGIRVPFALDVWFGAKPVTSIRFDRVTFGVEVPEGLFAKPTRDLASARYAPRSGLGWPVSTPAEQGLDPDLVAELYLDAAELPTLYALLVVKGGRLVGEGYFHEGGIDQLSGRQSVTKSFTSALVGLALERGCLTSLDQRMLEFFPELTDRIDDPRKERITLRELLQMRAGYPWEENEPVWFDRLFLQDDWHWVPHVADFPLTVDPGTEFRYSNLTSHILAVIVSRACATDLAPFAEAHLLGPIGAELGSWSRDADGYRFGSFDISVTARDMAKFGQLYLQGGGWDGRQVVPADWVRASLTAYSRGIFGGQMARHFRDVGYGYQWWSARVGAHDVDFAWGHGGNLIVLVPELDMVVVTAADPLHRLPGAEGWAVEGPILVTIGKFLASLPAE